MEAPEQKAPAETQIPLQSTSGSILLKGDAKHKFHHVVIDDILFIEGMRNYVSVVLKDNKKNITLQKMKFLEKDLASSGFIRIHKYYLVNLKQISLIEGNSITVGPKSLPIGGSY
jgi:two-component system response regulator LytT